MIKYPALAAMAEQEPLNNTQVVDAFEESIKPMREFALNNRSDSAKL